MRSLKGRKVTRMADLIIFENPEFGKVRTVDLDGEPWLVGKDVADVLGYQNGSRDINRHVDDEDRRIISLNDGTQDRNVIIINESGLYSLVLSSKLPTARKFRRWVTSEVLPSIRKTGGYNLPRDYPSALRALADAEEKRLALLAENEMQKQTIADFQPVKQYVDVILKSTGALATSQIAADYGMSAYKLNKILHEAGIQRNVNGQWILYNKYMGKGLTVSRTYNYTHSDGTTGSNMQTLWTQKGRMLIHFVLERKGIKPVMDRKEGESND